VRGALWDHAGLARARFAVPVGAAILLRPDQHIAARLPSLDPAAIAAAQARLLGGAA